MSNFNYDFITTNLDRPWSFKISEDAKRALIGFGDDEGQLTQFDMEKKEVSKSYWTEGSYTSSIEFLSNSKAIIGTSNGFVLFIDLERKEVLNKNKISDYSIKDLKLSNDTKIMYAITSNKILAFSTSSLKLIFSKDVEFNPWHIVLIPNTNMMAIEGNRVSLAVYKYTQNEFFKVDSVKYGTDNEDMISLSFNEKNSWLIATSEVGYLYIWTISSNGLKKQHEINFKGDELSWLQSDDDYIVFSTLSNGVSFITMAEGKLINIPKSKNGEIIKFNKIHNKYYLLYLIQGGIAIADIKSNDLEIYSLDDLPYGIRFIDFTQNGDIIGVTSEGIVISNFLQQKEGNDTKYNFNSKEKNIAVEKFIFNELDESIVLQCKDGTIKVISLVDTQISDIDFSFKDTYAVEIKGFYGENILLSNYQDIYILHSQIHTVKEIINQDEQFTSIKHIKLIDKNYYAIVNNSDYMATPIVWDYLKVYDFKGNEMSSQKLEDIYASMFVSNSKLVTTSMHHPSEIIDLETNEIMKFDIGYNFDGDGGTILFDNEKYAIRIAIGSHFNHYMSSYNLMVKEKNGEAKKIWEIEDPRLGSFSPLGYCKLDDYFYIVDRTSGEMMSIDKNSGDIINMYKLQNSIEDVEMSNSGKYIAWRLKTGEFSYISYPFKSCEVSDE